MTYSKTFQTFIQNFNNPLMAYHNGSKMMISDDLDEAMSANTHCDVYFFINGGPKVTDVTNYNAIFIDLDTGRDKNGKYFVAKKVQASKKKMIDKINQFPHKPSYIVETRNGYQVYWLLNQEVKDNHNTLRWKGVQQSILKFFTSVGSDPKTIKPNQIYRCPDTFWIKKGQGMPKFFCQIVVANPKTRYDLKDFQSIVKDNIIKPLSNTNGSFEWDQKWKAKKKNQKSTLNQLMKLSN